jgi:hypothetical protein
MMAREELQQGPPHAAPVRLARKFFVDSAAPLAGFVPTTGHHGPEPESAAPRPLSLAWITDELLAETRRVWSLAYERVIADEEAIEMLVNVKRFAETMLRAGEQNNERGDLG